MKKKKKSALNKGEKKLLLWAIGFLLLGGALFIFAMTQPSINWDFKSLSVAQISENVYHEGDVQKELTHENGNPYYVVDEGNKKSVQLEEIKLDTVTCVADVVYSDTASEISISYKTAMTSKEQDLNLVKWSYDESNKILTFTETDERNFLTKLATIWNYDLGEIVVTIPTARKDTVKVTLPNSPATSDGEKSGS